MTQADKVPEAALLTDAEIVAFVEESWETGDFLPTEKDTARTIADAAAAKAHNHYQPTVDALNDLIAVMERHLATPHAATDPTLRTELAAAKAAREEIGNHEES